MNDIMKEYRFIMSVMIMFILTGVDIAFILIKALFQQYLSFTPDDIRKVLMLLGINFVISFVMSTLIIRLTILSDKESNNNEDR